ncbi:DUF1853 family protein [Halovibrio sp. HP20-59]|uniref:DUF1853 family protein n=1 Tax=Halovibrio sp. HP20-59 TaxID=3080275 RepID=UPI003A523229
MPDEGVYGEREAETLATAGLGNSVLRDLAWLATTPDLITLPPPIPCGGRPSLQELGLQGTLLTWLRQLGPPPLAALNGHRNTRMGHYHERLWHTLLDHAPNTRLLASNVRIARQRNTLGELDMLYRTRCNPAPVHLEVAIKFYLGLPDGPGTPTSQSRWIGPGGLDSLAIKSAHLRRHQLPLSTTALAMKTLTHWLAPRDIGTTDVNLADQLTQRLAMPGVLYYPWHAVLPAPEGATPDHRRGRWCYVSDWPALASCFSERPRVAWLAKPHWLAPPPRDAFRPLAEQLPAVIDRVKTWQSAQQIMLYFADEQNDAKGGTQSYKKGYERLFLVPDQWPRQVPLPPIEG